ncbi:ABC transporter substrate-binding protein [Rhizobium hainanense]|uniref:Carbohydrate ABC transporter substrate-binding protein, CUT1 family n=1 Tax=Rhizobium hainanense TaxID=52131 RepID=A0A1C3W9I9_9HYPH|nr:extracellular solute-binding protein [Rhizobium hainanense]SCB36571.1 carbohydrate ABC transporter substrate-binding protein, CUT1 family [Rhizobium hainanense]
MSSLKSMLLAGALVLAPVAALADTVTLEVASWKGNEAEPAGLPELIKKFELQHPDIKVKLTYVGRNDFNTAVSPRLAGGNSPDVVMADMVLMRQWARAGLLSELDKGDWFAKIEPTLRDALSKGTGNYVFPLEVIGIGNFVNMGLLKKSGIEKPPATVDEVKAACKALNAAGIQPMIMAPGFPASVFMMAQGLAAGEAPAGDYGTGSVPFAKSKAFTDALGVLKDLDGAGCFKGKEQAGVDAWSTGLQEFKAGHFAMMPQGAWNIAAFGKVEGLDFVFTPIPSAKAPGVAFDLFGFGWALPKHAAHEDAAKAWIEFFRSDENLKILLKGEAAGSPFAGGSTGTPPQAASYEAARTGSGLIWYPVGLAQWPAALETEIFSSMAGFLANTSASPKETLSKWDEVVEDQK